MRNALQDQLLKAGLVNEKALKKANKEKKAQQPKAPKGQRSQADEARLLAEQALAEKAEHSRQLNQQQKEQQHQRELAAQIRQLIENNRQPRGDREVPYNFADGKAIKKMFVSQVVVNQLSRGQLAIVRLNDQYDLVPRVVAEKIAERDPACVVVCVERSVQTEDADDPYKDYKIPDDLMW